MTRNWASTSHGVARRVGGSVGGQRLAVGGPEGVLRGHLTEFATDRLVQYLLHLGSDVEIVVHKPGVPPKREGVISVAYL